METRIIGPTVDAREREALPRRRLTQEIFPTVPPDILETIEPILAYFEKAVREMGFVDRFARSGAMRQVVPNPEIDRTRAAFAHLGEMIPSLRRHPIIGPLMRGSNDMDLNIAAGSRSYPEDVEGEDEDRLSYLFTWIAQMYLENRFAGKELIELGEENGRQYYVMEIDGFNEIEISYGRIGTNPKVKGIEMRYTRDGNEVFITHVGFYSQFEHNKRAGFLVSDGSQFSVVLGSDEDYLTIDENEVSLRDKAKQLLLPDKFASRSKDKDISADMERTLRAIRNKIFYHIEPDREEDVSKYKQYFTETEWKDVEQNTDIFSRLFTHEGWDRIIDVISTAIRKYQKEPPPPYMQGVFIKEIMVMAEADPYLFLMICEKTDLLRIFPMFRDVSPFYVRSLLTSDAFSFAKERGGFVPRERRSHRSVMKSREYWKKSGYSGLKLLTDAFTNEQRDTRISCLSEEQVDYLISFDGNNIVGALGFGEVGRLRDPINVYDESYYRSLTNRLCKIASQKLQASGIQYSREVHTFVRDTIHAIMNKVVNKDNIEFNFTEVIKSPRAAINQIKNVLIPLGIISPIGGDLVVITEPDILEDLVTPLSTEEDRNLRTRYIEDFMRAVELIQGQLSSKRAEVLQGKIDKAGSVSLLGEKYVEHILKNSYFSAKSLFFNKPPLEAIKKWLGVAS